VCSLPSEAAGILGTDWKAKVGVIIDFECYRMVLRGNPNVCAVCDATPTGQSPRLPYSCRAKKDTAFNPPRGDEAFGNAASCPLSPAAAR